MNTSKTYRLIVGFVFFFVMFWLGHRYGSFPNRELERKVKALESAVDFQMQDKQYAKQKVMDRDIQIFNLKEEITKLEGNQRLYAQWHTDYSMHDNGVDVWEVLGNREQIKAEIKRLQKMLEPRD